MAASKFSSASSLIMINFLPFFMICLCRHCYADTNQDGGSTCWPSSEAKSSSAWTENVNTLFSKLEANVILNNGYYRAEAGEKGPDRVYGHIQCRGDISKSNCTNCTRESFILSANRSSCGGLGSKGVLIWQRWCLLRYSNVSFYGTWEKSSLTVYRPNRSSSEDPAAAAKGTTMMLGLAAAAPGESFMFATGEIDDGVGGKRYGLAQCTRDLGKSDCRDCLEFLVKGFGTVSDDRSCEINGVGCFMLYDDTIRFYFNTTAEEGLRGAANRGLSGRLTMTITIFMTAMAFL